MTTIDDRPWYSVITDWFTSDDSPSSTVSSNSFNWGQLLKPAITTGWQIYSGMLKEDQEDAALEEKRRQFDAQMALEYAKLAKAGAGGGGGGGIDPRMLALQRQQANDAAFFKRLEAEQMAERQKSDAIRNLIAAYQNAYD